MRAAQMPGGKIFFASTTYNQILTKTLPAIENIWQSMGLQEDVHYVVGRKPPGGWKNPFSRPRKYANIISFRNGFCIDMLSMDRPDLVRGGSFDGGEIDEAALIDAEDFRRILIPSIRGNAKRFKSWMHGQVSLYTSMPWLPSGYWIFDFEEKAKIDPRDYFFLEANAFDNIAVLGEESIRRMEREMSYLEFQIEVMNSRMIKVPDGFYNRLDEKKHTYVPAYTYDEGQRGITVTGSRDVKHRELLELSFDFSGWFNCMSVWQQQDDTEKCLRQFHVKGDDKLHELVDKFSRHFLAHEFKFVRIWGEPRGHDKQPMGPTIYESLKKIFESKGWGCEISVPAGRTTDHIERHHFISEILLEENPLLPKIRINREECKDLIISLQTTQLTPDFRKNKSKEKDRDYPQEHATHYTDTFDYYLVQKHGWKVMGLNSQRASQVMFG